jgi:hypothetical protein
VSVPVLNNSSQAIVPAWQVVFARAVFKAAIAEKPDGRFMIRSRTRVVKRHPEGGSTTTRMDGLWGA